RRCRRLHADVGGLRLYKTYAGKPLITESDSVHIARDCTHWRDEIATAIRAGKVVFVALARPQEVYYYTGERSVSGTGRSQSISNHVTPIGSYASIPVQLKGLVPRGG